MNRLPLACLLVLPLLGNIAAGEDPPAWPQWRGPLGTGEAPGDPPVEWSETENVRWKFRLAGLGHSTPVIWGDAIFVTSAEPFQPAGTGRVRAQVRLALVCPETASAGTSPITRRLGSSSLPMARNCMP